MTNEDDLFDLEGLWDVLDHFGHEEKKLFPLFADGPGVTNEPFVFDLATGEFTNESTRYTPVIGRDLNNISDVMVVYKHSSKRMQKAIRNTAHFFCYLHSLRQGYQGDLLVNWLGWAYEDWSTILLVLDSCPEYVGLGTCRVASFSDIKEYKIIVTKRAIDRSVVEEVRPPVSETSQSNMDRVPAISWRDVSFEDKTVVDSYMDNEYGKHVKEALSILMKFPTYDEWVAVGDGPGVVYEACKVLKKTCYSTDISETMIEAGKKRENEVARCDAFEALANTSCPIIVMYNSLSIHGLLHYIAIEYPRRKVIVVSPVDAFDGRGKYRRYNGRSRLYYRNIEMPAGIMLKKSGPRPCNYTDFWDPAKIYCIDNDRSYNLAKTFRRMSVPIKLSAYESKYKEGLTDVCEPDISDVYMYDTIIQPAHRNFFNMNTGKSGKLREVLDHNSVDCGVYCTRGVINDAKFLARDHIYRYYEIAKDMECIERHGTRVRKVYFDNISNGVPIVNMTVPEKNNKRRKPRKRRKRKK